MCLACMALGGTSSAHISSAHEPASSSTSSTLLNQTLPSPPAFVGPVTAPNRPSTLQMATSLRELLSEPPSPSQLSSDSDL